MKPEEGRIGTAQVNGKGEQNLANQQEISSPLPLARGTTSKGRPPQIDIDIRPAQTGNSPGLYTDRTLSSEENRTAESCDPISWLAAGTLGHRAETASAERRAPRPSPAGPVLEPGARPPGSPAPAPACRQCVIVTLVALLAHLGPYPTAVGATQQPGGRPPWPPPTGVQAQPGCTLCHDSTISLSIPPFSSSSSTSSSSSPPSVR